MTTPAPGVSDTGRLRALVRDAMSVLDRIAAAPIPIRPGEPATAAALHAHELAVTAAARLRGAVVRPSEQEEAGRG